MSLLREKNLDVVLRERIKNQQPTLAICLGLQLLCESSEESPGVVGLGILPIKVKRFSTPVVVPQIGWNEVLPDSNCRLIPKAEMYFANSYCLPAAPQGWNVATANHGEEFIAAVEREAVLGCQFHAELSSSAGAKLLKNWFEKGAKC
jgi:imidazole glycerol phosphate synthase glutamine amidotransferase subunit